MATYALLSEVKGILRSWGHLHTGGRRIDFSEVYVNLRADDNNSTPTLPSVRIRLTRVDFVDSWEGVVLFDIEFTDPTTFDVSMIPAPNETEVPLASGGTGALYTALNPFITTPTTIFTINPTYWVGVAAAGDQIGFESKAIFSNVFAESILVQAQFIIDSWILAHPSRKIQSLDFSTLVFPNVATGAAVPPQINTATMYLAAFLLWGLANPVADLAESQVFQWWSMAKNLTMQVVEAVTPRMAQYVSRQPIVPVSPKDKIGTTTLGFDVLLRQRIEISLADVLSRLRDYQIDESHINYISKTSGFA